MKPEKVAYLMHVSWDWIKQRPHFLYEELTRHYKVDLFYVERLLGKHRKKIVNKRVTYSTSNVKKIVKLPYSGRFTTLKKIESVLNGEFDFKNYDIVWITSPIMLEFINIDELRGKKVIYDCMDDFVEFYQHPKKKDAMKKLEEKLIERADIVFTSSQYLSEKIIKQYKVQLNNIPILINNGVDASLIEDLEKISRDTEQASKTDSINLVYIGTVGQWVDFDLILGVLKNKPNIQVTMIGPVDTIVPSHERLKFVGMVEHHKLPLFAKEADALIMPFQLNELVRSVDPVKIYEYIVFRRPIIVIEYGEIEKFRSFVHSYHEYKDFLSLLDKLEINKLKLCEIDQARDFLYKSTWFQRSAEIIKIIEE